MNTPPRFAPPPAMVELPAVFVLLTAPQPGHPNYEYTHRCDVTLFGEPMWSLWGRSAEEAEKAALFQVKSRVTLSLGRSAAANSQENRRAS